MTKNLLIVEGDSELSLRMRSVLEGRGFAVSETSDGRATQDLIRRSRPDLVLLGVELPNNQNGYIICGKLKKDDELRTTPVVIVGSPEGFAKHRSLKTRADEYVAHPVQAEDLLAKVGQLVGLPSEAVASEIDESLSLSDLLEPQSHEPLGMAAEEISVEPDEDSLAQAFEGSPSDSATTTPTNIGSIETDEQAERAFDDFTNEEPLPQAEAAVADEAPPGSSEPYDAPSLASHPPGSTAKIEAPVTAGPSGDSVFSTASSAAELEAANSRISELETRVMELETSLATKEAEVARMGGGGRSEKELFALKDSLNKRDKEILRLKNELNAKENELLELRDKENQLEQQLAESTSEQSQRDAQIKLLTTKSEHAGAERKKLEQFLAAAKDEARQNATQLIAAQGDVRNLRDQLAARQVEVDRLTPFELQARQANEELEAARGQLEELRRHIEGFQGELEASRTQLAQHTEETSTLRARVGELEATSAQAEERLTKLYARVKHDEKLREKTKKALAIALQLLEDNGNTGDDIDVDEDVAA